MRNIASVLVAALAVMAAPRGEREAREDAAQAQAQEVSLLRCSDGGEHWRGVTVAARGGHSPELVEDVSFDAAGRLVRAETVAHDRAGGGPDVRVLYDRGASAVVVVTGGHTTLHVMEGSGAWAYGAVATAAGAIPTRLAALVAYRAGHDAPSLRLVDASHGTSALVPTDQVLVETERGPVAVLGDEAFELRTLVP